MQGRQCTAKDSDGIAPLISRGPETDIRAARGSAGAARASTQRTDDGQKSLYGDRTLQGWRRCPRLPPISRPRAARARGPLCTYPVGWTRSSSAATNSWRQIIVCSWMSGSHIGATSSTSRCIPSSVQQRQPKELLPTYKWMRAPALCRVTRHDFHHGLLARAAVSPSSVFTSSTLRIYRSGNPA